jgi:hypothetical protein
MASTPEPTGPMAPLVDVATALFADVCDGLSFEEFINHDDLLESLSIRLRKLRVPYRLEDVLHSLATLRRRKDGLGQSKKRAHHDRLPSELREAVEQCTVAFRNAHGSRTIELLLIDPVTRQEFDDLLQAEGVLPEMLPAARRVAQNLTKDTGRHRAAIAAVQAKAVSGHTVGASAANHSAEKAACQELAEQLKTFADSHPALADDVRRIVREIQARDGQQQFRQRLVTAYGGACVISECSILSALQAAHIRPFEGSSTHTVTNGLLMRSDLHALFDAHLLGIEPATLAVHFHPAIVASGDYEDFHGVTLQPPGLAQAAPDRAHLRKRWELFCERSRQAL